MTARGYPYWWDWELELSPHVLKRMIDRRFAELDLRRMMGRAKSVRPDIAANRWVASTRFRRVQWEVVLEPDPNGRVVVVITAYPIV